MSRAMFPSDTITFKVSTGDNSAGNGFAVNRLMNSTMVPSLVQRN